MAPETRSPKMCPPKLRPLNCVPNCVPTTPHPPPPALPLLFSLLWGAGSPFSQLRQRGVRSQREEDQSFSGEVSDPLGLAVPPPLPWPETSWADICPSRELPQGLWETQGLVTGPEP